MNLLYVFSTFTVSVGGHVGVGKAFMKLRGLDLGPPRLPLLPLSMDEFISLKKDLTSIGFSEWA